MIKMLQHVQCLEMATTHGQRSLFTSGYPKRGSHASRAEVKRRSTTGLPPKRLLLIQCARAESK